MQIAILTLDGFNELDSFIAAGILNRMKSQGWAAHITCPTPEVTSMAGVTIQRQKPLEFLADADAVLEDLSSLSAELAQIVARTRYRMSATQAYAELCLDRIRRLEVAPVRGYRSLDDFTERRLLPAMRTWADAELFDSLVSAQKFCQSAVTRTT